MAQKFLTDIEVSGKLFTTDEVGIGVSDALAKLHVDSSTAFSLTSAAGDTLFLSDDTNDSLLNAVGASIGFSGPQAVQRQAAISALRTGDDHDKIGLAFYTHPGTGNDETIEEKVRITHDGKVGINAIDPLRTLHVVGNMAVNAGTGEYYGVLMSGGEGANPTITIGDWHNSSGTIKWDSTANILKIDSQHSTATSAIAFTGNDGATEYARFTGNGSLGIGTTDPYYYNNYRHLTIDGTSGAGLMLKNNGSNKYEQYTDSGGTIFYNIDNVPQKFYTNSVERMRINSDGTVGIGPNALDTPGGDMLHVDGTLRVGPHFSTSDRDHIKLIPHGTDTRILSPNERFHIENPDGHIVITPDTGGGVGIGLDDPDAKLSIYQSGGTVLDVQGSDGQLFSVTDTLNGDLLSVSDVSGIPILNVNSSGAVDIDGTLSLGDSAKIQLGASQDLQIYHDGTNSYISEVGTGDLIISADNDLTFKDGSGNIMANMNASNSVELMYGNSKKFETSDTGITITGNISAITASGHNFMLGNSNNTTTADTSGFRLHQSSYTDGRYAHRFRKYDQGGGVPLYIDGSGSTANIFTALARFGTYTGEAKTFEVFGTMGATNFSGSSSGTNTGDQTLPTDFVVKSTGGTFDGNLSINIADVGSAPAMTALFNLKGYGGRGAGIKIKDSVNSGTDPSSREWFVGSGYGQSGFNIGYSATGSQSSYLAQNKFALGTDGNAIFAGTVTANGTQLTGNQTLPTDFVSAANGGTFSGNITASNLSGTNTGDQTNIAGNSATTTLATNSSKLGGYTLAQIDHAEAFHTFDNIDADSTQAKRYHIGRLYGCPAHWDGNWQNIEFNVTAESYESGHLRYKLMGDYGGSGSQANMMDLYLKEASGPMVGRFRFVLGTPVDAGWDHSGQDTFYVDLYAEASHYSQWQINIKTYGHGTQNTNPTSGGATTVFYDSPTVSNIETFNEGQLAIHHLEYEIYHEGHKPTLAELGAAADTVVNQTDFVSATTGGNFGGNLSVHTGAGTGSLSVGRTSDQSIKLYITDTNNSITAAQDSDSNQEHNFVLNRTFAGTGANNFKIQKGGSDQFTLNSAGLATFAGSVQITGALTVNGTTTIINTATVEVEDNILQLNTTQGTGSNADTATAATSGISIYRGVDENDAAITQASLIFDDGDDTWDLTNALTVAGNVIGASFAVPSGASTGFLKADGSVDGTTYSGYNFGASDLTFQGADPGDIAWKEADGTEVHRIWAGSADYLTYRNDAGTAYGIIHEGFSGYNNGNWDNAFTHAESAHAPSNAEANVYSNASELLTGLNTLTNPIFTDGLSKKNSRYQSGITSEYPLGHYTPGETLFEIDATWSNSELQSYFDTPNVSWDEVANAPGGYAIYINGSNGVGGPYASGFPMIPIDEDATYYQECWIKNATSSTMGHYMGSADLEADRTPPSSGAGNPGSYGYWVMSNTNPGDTWTKVSGYITGHHASNTGSFETDATYFTPLALFNYTTPAAGTRACWISGWKVIRVDKVGDRIFQDDVQVKGKLEVHTLDANTSSTTALVMNVNEVEKRTLGSLAFSNATIPTVAGVYLPLAGGTMTGAITSIGANNTSKISFLDVKRGSGAGLYLRFQTDSTAANNVSQFVIRRSTDNADLLSIGATSGDVSVTGDVQIDSALLSNQENTNIDTGAEVVAQVAHATYTAAFFDFVIKKGTNIKSGTVFACHDGTNVEFTETSTNDLGDTSDVTLSVDKTSTHLRLIATVTSDDWSVKSLIRAL